MIRLNRFLLVLWLACAAPTAVAQTLPSIEEKTEGLEKRDGYFPLYWDAAEGAIFLEVPRLEEDFLYVVSLPAGLGSNDVGLDRGQLGAQRVVRFERTGPKVLLVAPNVDYRAETSNEAERRAVRDAFAEGIVWGFTAVAETGGRVLVDATDFIIRDAHGAARQLERTGQGSFELDESRSVPHLAMTKSFPQNTEMEARLTFTTDSPGRYVRQTAADPEAVTLRMRHSLVHLPDDDYTPRAFDPRSGYNLVAYRDYAAPVDAPITQRVITRHRLRCATPRDAEGLCEPEEPIVYHLDPGTPEPVRTALLEGARWWKEAFRAAGFRNGFQVEMLPEDADPMDVRYNVIQWVHRATRGWSYGSSVRDPRTGEIIKGHVTLGSLRVRQDYLLAEGMLLPYTDGFEEGLPEGEDPMLEMALARIRQLSAHEVGHTLGIRHNFAASVNDRASVMDYPAPYATVAPDGSISLEDAYDRGIGEWDKITLRYGYTTFDSDEAEREGLEAILQEKQERGLLYITDADARPSGAAHPEAHLWDNGTDAAEALRHEMAVREAALERFGPEAIRTGEPMALLEEVFVPLYLRHRYQVAATAKLLGGVRYGYALRGSGHDAPTPVGADAQRSALEALLDAVEPQALALPEAARQQIPPRPPGYGMNRELFERHTGLTFDPYAPAEVAAGMVFSALVQPQRAARLAHQADFHTGQLSLREVLRRTTERVWQAPLRGDPYTAGLRHTAQHAWTDALLEAAAQDQLTPTVHASLFQHLRELRDWLDTADASTEEAAAHYDLAHETISRFLDEGERPSPSRQHLDVPPGSPIGQDAPAYLQRQEARQALLERWTPRLGCGMR